MLKCSKVILCSAVLNLSIFLTISFSFADIDKNSSDQMSSNVQECSILTHNIEKICKDSQATIEENKGNWYKISMNGKSGWVYGEVFPVESIKASSQTKNSDKAEVLTDKPQVVTDENNLGLPSAVVESTDKANEEVLQDTLKTEAEVSEKTEGEVSKEVEEDFSEEVSTSNKAGTVAVVIEGVITGDDVNVREGSGTDYKVICQVYTGDKVDILGKSSDWYNIKTKDGVCGWVYGTYVSTGSTLASRGETTDSGNSSKRTQIVAYAKDLLGVRYVYGGTSRSGFDCSGFVWHVFNHYGIKLNRVASDQATQGTKVSKSNLQLGDLVFFDTNGGMNHINHVGIYIGNGSFIHASSGSKAKKVVISELNSGFYNGCYMTGRRILN